MADDVLLFFDDLMVAHDPGRYHPEQPARLSAIVDHLRAHPVPGTGWRTPTPCPREALERVHDPRYLDALERVRGRRLHLDPDTGVSEHSIDAMLLAAGAAVQAVQAVHDGEARSALALVRPPGHHAERREARGFCLVNNIAVAAEHAVKVLGYERVLIVDWDVHHGNGTQHAFENRHDVLYLSSHRYPFFPGTGSLAEVGHGAGRGFTVNAPIPAGLSDRAHLALYQRLCRPIADTFHPDLVLVSAGFDGHESDPLGGMRMTTEGFRELAILLRHIAEDHADGRIILVLEGGYDLDALADCVRACTEVLAGPCPTPPPATTSRAESIIARICQTHAHFWPGVA